MVSDRRQMPMVGEPSSSEGLTDPVTQIVPIQMFRPANRRNRIRYGSDQLVSESGAAEHVRPSVHALPMTDRVVRVHTPRLFALVEMFRNLRTEHTIVLEDHQILTCCETFRPHLAHRAPV